MDIALKDDGQAIIFEPVLSEKEEQKTRKHDNPEQEMDIRPISHYDELFKKYSWERLSREIYKKSGINNEDMVGYVFNKFI